MIKYLISSFFTLFLLFSCQPRERTEKISTKVDTNSIANDSLAEENYQTLSKDSICKCIDTNLFNSNKFLPPFNNSKKIVLYDFNSKAGFGKSTKSWEELINGSSINKKSIKLLNVIELTYQNQIELQHILFDKIEKCKTDNYYQPVTDCAYNPHHCIVFYDNNGNAIDFLEICFICDSKRSSNKNDFGSFCGDTYCELRKFAQKVGIDKKRLFGEWCQ
jgi:hypothetical protein